MADATVVAAGTPSVAGTAAVTSANATTVATGHPVGYGTAAITAANATVAATGHPVGYGTAAITAANATTVATGTPTVSGSANATLADATAEGYGGNSANVTLENAGCVATGHPVVTGSAAAAVGNATLIATGHPVVRGSGVPQLQDSGGAATGAGIVEGDIAAPMDNVVALASGQPIVRGTGVSTLTTITALASGRPVAKGSAAITLAGFAVESQGTPVYDVELVSAALASSTSLVLTYSSPPRLSAQSVQLGEWTIFSTNGAAVTILGIETAGDTIILTTTEHTEGADYTVVPSPNLFSVSRDRVLPPYSADYTGVGIVPTVTKVLSIDERTLRVFFSENMLDEDLLDPDSYTIDGTSGDPHYATPRVLAVTKITDNNVDLTHTSLVRDDPYDLTVEVRDQALNQVA